MGRGSRILDAQRVALQFAGQDPFLAKDCVMRRVCIIRCQMSTRDDEVRIGCDRPREVLVSEAERGSPFGLVIASINFGR